MTPNQLIELTHQSTTPAHAYDTLLWALRESFDSDVGMLHVAAAYPITNCGPVATLGFDRQRIEAAADRWATYVEELDPLRQYAARTGTVVRERDVFSQSALSNKAFQRELTAPEGGVESLVAYLPWRGRYIAALMLGSRKRYYSVAARSALGELVPSLSMAVVAAAAQSAMLDTGARLTRREQEVIGYVEAGLTNAEIGQCLGTSSNTVRNQVASIMGKLALDSRVQLARCGLSSFGVSHR